MAPESIASNSTRSRKTLAGIAMGSIAIAGVLAAAAVALGGDIWKASSTAGIIFLATMLLLVSFVAVHRWLRVSQWVLAPIVALLSSIQIWWDGDYGVERVGPTGELAYMRTDYGIFSDWSMGLWWIVGALVLLSFFSRTWEALKNSPSHRAAISLVYYAVFAITLVAATVALVSSGLEIEGDSVYLLQSVLAILGLTGATIVIISAFVNRPKRQSQEIQIPANSPQLPEAVIARIVDARIAELLDSPAWRDLFREKLQLERSEDSAKSLPEDLEK